jgi:hypothetical protein
LTEGSGAAIACRVTRPKKSKQTPRRKRPVKIRPPTATELAGDLVGCVEGPGDLSTNPKYMEGFGRSNRPAQAKETRRAGGKSLAQLFADSPLKGLNLLQGAEAVVSARRADIEALDMRFVGEGVGLAQALDGLRDALNEISACLDRRDYRKAADLGYGRIAEMFVFLQRTLGGLQDACGEKEALVSEVASELRCAYEDALPYVDAVLSTSRPLTSKERKEARKALPKIKARIRAMAGKSRSSDNKE